jgi:CDP-4-dehydro-6-deoxyglucose reductase, E1
MYWKLQENVLNEADIETLIDFIRHTKRFTQFEKVREFEKEFSRWLGTKYCVYVNSGSSANLLLIAALKELYQWKLNDEIIVPAVTWVTNVSPVMQCGLKPVFLDINLKDLSFAYDQLEAAITPKTKAVFVTHLIGFPADIKKIDDIIADRDIQIIEDCCESHGATINNTKVGNFGIGSSFSFYWGHHITSVEGGAVCTNNEDLYKMVVLKRSHGLARELPVHYHKEIKALYPDINFDFLFLTDGYNFRNTEFNAVLGLNQISKIDSFIEIRNRNYERFLKICEPYEKDLILFRNNGMSSFVLPFLFRRKGIIKEFLNVLTANEIESRPIISGNLLVQPFLKEYKQNSFPNADLLHRNGCYIGNNQFVNGSRLDRIEHILIRFFR